MFFSSIGMGGKKEGDSYSIKKKEQHELRSECVILSSSGFFNPTVDVVTARTKLGTETLEMGGSPPFKHPFLQHEQQPIKVRAF